MLFVKLSMYVWLAKFVFYAGKRYQFMITRCSKLAVKKIIWINLTSSYMCLCFFLHWLTGITEISSNVEFALATNPLI